MKEKFGDIDHALVVKYAGTDHSKGCAFVQFKRAEDAQTCLEVCVCVSVVRLNAPILLEFVAISRRPLAQLHAGDAAR
jgi:hypothetical protein